METRDRILAFIRMHGPVIPAQLIKELNTTLLMASAFLSELASNRLVRVSTLKMGGTPLYYLPGQEEQLEKHSKYLHEKEQRALELLREKKVLRDTELTPVTRVALREIRDFAKPLEVTVNDTKEIFWKYHLVPTQEAEALIKASLGGAPKQPEQRQIPAEETPKEKTAVAPAKKPEIQKTIPKQARPTPSDDFTGQVERYFTKNKIEVVEAAVIRKNSEADFVISVPSAVGMLTYYCKAKNKKRVTDGDLSSTFIQGQSKKLPTIFLTTGELTKRAKDMLAREFKGMSIQRI